MVTKPTFWTKERVILALDEMLDQLMEEEKFKPSRQTYQLGELFVQRRLPPQYLSEWANEYPDVKEISEPISTMKKIMELRLNKAGMKNNLNSYMVIFNLKNNYGWKEESTVHDDAKDKTTKAVSEIVSRLANRRKSNVKIKKQ